MTKKRLLHVPMYPAMVEILSGDLAQAYVLQWIDFRCKTEHVEQSYRHEGEIWYRGAVSTLSSELSITPARVRSATEKLVKSGYLESAQHAVEGWTDRATSYRPTGLMARHLEAEFDLWQDPDSFVPSNECSSMFNEVNTPSDLCEKTNRAMTPKKSSPQGSEVDRLFDEWYRLYPRKKNPTPARKSFKSALRKLGGDPTLLFEGVREYALEVAGKETKYIAHPTTWLNDCRWENLEQEDDSSSLQAVITDLINSGEFKKLFELTGTSGPRLGSAELDILEDLSVDDRKRQKEVWQRAWATENLDDLVRRAEKRKANSN